jgi:hypothetical protein
MDYIPQPSLQIAQAGQERIRGGQLTLWCHAVDHLGPRPVLSSHLER